MANSNIEITDMEEKGVYNISEPQENGYVRCYEKCYNNYEHIDTFHRKTKEILKNIDWKQTNWIEAECNIFYIANNKTGKGKRVARILRVIKVHTK